MTLLDFLKVAQDYSTKRKLLLKKIGRVLSSCSKREECVAKLFKVLSNFLEEDPEENTKIALSVASSLPAEYATSVVKFIEAFSTRESNVRYPNPIGHSLDDVGRALTGGIECSDLENIVYVASESKDFIAIALTLAILERASELKSCDRDLARSLLALIRRLYERGNKDLVTSILNKYSVKIYVLKSGEEIKSAKVTIGNEISVDLTEVMSLVYSDLSVILNSGGTKS
ncbi:MAG: hypothetical protein QW543_00800 [Sulfolobales archaeon]